MQIIVRALPRLADDTAVEIITTGIDETTEYGYLIYGFDGRVRHIYVAPDYRRCGIATAMWTKANDLHRGAPHRYPLPVHSAHRSRAGDAWARSLGVFMPPLQLLGS